MTMLFASLMGYTFALMGRVCHVTGGSASRALPLYFIDLQISVLGRALRQVLSATRSVAEA